MGIIVLLSKIIVAEVNRSHGAGLLDATRPDEHAAHTTHTNAQRKYRRADPFPKPHPADPGVPVRHLVI